MGLPFLTYLLSLGGGLALLYLACSARERFPHAGFLVLGAVASLVSGLASLHAVLSAHLERSALTVFWWPLFGLGFLVVGAVVSLLWLVAVQGLARLMSRGQGPLNREQAAAAERDSGSAGEDGA